MSNWRKTLALFLCLAMCLSVFPMSAFAQEEEALPPEETGTEEVLTQVAEAPEEAATEEEPAAPAEETTEPESETTEINVAGEASGDGVVVSGEPGEDSADETQEPTEPGTTDGEVTDEVTENQDVTDETAGEGEGEKGDAEETEGEEVFGAKRGLDADEEEEEQLRDGETNTCGDGVYWELSSDNTTLTISGYGAIYDYENTEIVPWYDHMNDITSVVFDGTITRIGKYAFYSSENLTTITLPEGLESIGERAFKECTKLAKVLFPAL